MKILFALLCAGSAFGQTDWINQVKNKPFTDVRSFNFAPITPGGTINPGTTTITLKPVPNGINGTDVAHYLYISGGTGTAEACLITGGTAMSNTSSGTVNLACSNTHTGAWTVSSSTAGIFEAITAQPGTEIFMPSGHYLMHWCLALDPTKPIIMTGEGSGSTATTTFLDFETVTGCSAISLTDTGVVFSTEPKIFRHFQMQGTGTTTGGSGFLVINTVRVRLDDVQVNSFALSGLTADSGFELTVTGGSQFLYNGRWGLEITGVANLDKIENSYFNLNSRSNGFGGISIIGSSSGNPAESITLDNIDIEGSGGLPFTTVTSSYGLFAQNVTGLTVTGSYFEGNITAGIVYQSGITSLTEFSNWIGANPILYGADTTKVNSKGLTFNGTAAVRSIFGVSLTTLALGPDTCLSGSGECAAHPHYTGDAQTAPQTVETLPACNVAFEGTRSGVSNSNAASFAAGIGAVVATGGTTHVPVYCDGTNWRIG